MNLKEEVNSKVSSSQKEDTKKQMFDLMDSYGHEQMSVWHDSSSGYRSIIAIHSTKLGPALGGTRLWTYADDMEALVDVLRLSQGMTYKAAVSGLNLGGGKSVILGNGRSFDREAVFLAHGRHIESLGGRYISAEDVGTTPADMEIVHRETKHVVGLPERSGNPSPVTAFGVYNGIKACAQFRYQDNSLKDKKIAIQGAGSVGYHLCKLLHEEGAQLIISDINAEKVKKIVDAFNAKSVVGDEIYTAEADIFAPCAMGAIINDKTIERLSVDIIAGAANNQLKEKRHGEMLREKNITYAPDYVINSGGLINVSGEIAGWSVEESRHKVSLIYDLIIKILEMARDRSISTHRAANEIAEKRLEAATAKSS